MEAIEELDLRPLIPIKRHEKLKKFFKGLPAEESFVFINDHDPKPLYYEFRSIFGNVVGCEAEKKDWKYAVFHRYGMMQKGDTMELIAENDPEQIHTIFENKFSGDHTWAYKKREDEEYVIHITKEKQSDLDDSDISIVNVFDVRPHPPAKRHEMVFEAFDELEPGEAFVFINDHDPKPLYYQMEAENNEPFKWEYLEAMPQEWKVKVMKLDETD
jgi:uncharacterized protein (DUF2249 family)